MPTVVAFLRAVNLGAERRFGKDALAAATRAAGATDVTTYLNTGNVVCDIALTDPDEIEQVLEAAYLADRGFPVPTMVRTVAQLRAVHAEGETLAANHEGAQYVVFAKHDLTPHRAALTDLTRPGERIVVGDRVLHLLVDPGAAAGRLVPAAERRVGPLTVRTAAVVGTVVTRWCADPATTPEVAP